MTRSSSIGTGARPGAAAAGFTLIELMITVAILGILVAIALPAYNSQVARSRRADVQAALLQDAQYMQRYYASNNTYQDVTSVSPAITPVLTFPSSPKPDIGPAVYTIAISQRDDTSFTLTATRVSPGIMANDACGDFTYDSMDVKGNVRTTGGKGVADCWR